VGGSGSGGAGTGGRSGSGGAGVGGASTTGTGGTAAGGSGALGGAGGSAPGGSSGNSGADAGAAQSAGCGKTRTLQNGTINITFGGASRKYILLVPDGYDNTHPYRMVFAFAESGSSAQSVADRKYFTMATLDSKNTIFAAPDAVGSAGSWSKTDVDFTDAILAQLQSDLCIDTTRIFATGFSFGGAMSMAIACTRADVFRAVAFFSGADLTGSCPTTLTKPIAYYASQASQDANGMDPTNPMTGEMKQAQFAALNGCTAEPASTTFPAAGQPHTCTIYKGCSAGHPTEYCVFNGGHGWEPTDPGQSTSWDAPEAWKFITQF
jgi:poly(3-hydroxybutyrate) depolymerase